VSITLPSFISELLLVLGHRYLWKGGIEHNDISVTNLMYDKAKNDAGVLNDFDLANVRGCERPSGTERMGTMPFMALDLLTEDAWAGNVERLYRHDCESFAWVLLWICSRYDNGAEIKNPPFSQFITFDFLQCYEKKHTCGTEISKIKPTASYENYWLAPVRLIEEILIRRLVTELRKAKHEPTDDKVVWNVEDVLKKAGFNVVL
jgi:hypothetical protein